MKKLLCLSLFILHSTFFNLKAQFVLNGNASVTTPECSDSTTTYLLTPNLNNQSGQIWYTTQISLTNFFDIQFEMYLGTKAYSVGADGICFVFQQQSVNAGSNGGGLGYAGITPSLAAEFDTYENAWDPAYCHTAIEKNGDVEHTDNSGNNLAGPVYLSPTHSTLPDGNWHNVEVIWNPVYDSLSVYFDCSYRVGWSGNAIDSIFGGNPNVYWGFTAGTGGADNKQEVCVAHSYLNNLRDTAVCIGDSVKLTVSGGVSYTWGPPSGLNYDTGANVYANPDSTTTYTVSIKNSCGLISKDSVTIKVNPLPTALMGAPTNVLCFGGNTGRATVNVSGGTSPYTYSWSPAGGSNSTGTGLTAGTYSVFVTDSNRCGTVLTSTVVVTQPTAITATVITDDATCANNNGQISASTGGGTSPYTYLWSPGGATNAVVTGLSTGNYTVIIMDANGCIDTISGNVGINKTFSVSVAGLDTACKGQNIILTASGAVNYLWSNSSTTSSITVSPIFSTTYWVIGTTGVCTDSIPHAITVYKPLISSMTLEDSICPGNPVVLKVVASGGKPSYTYSWNGGITNDSPGPITVYPATTTTYSVLITDECKYISKDSLHVKVFPVGNVSFTESPPGTVAAGQPITFTNTSLNENPYYWSFGDGGTSSEMSPTYVYDNPGTYIVILTGYNSDGCVDTATNDVVVTPEINIPNVFTPNGDGKNDVLYFIIGGASCYSCDIYNRWGELVYESRNPSAGWNGLIRQTEQEASTGTYYYIVNYCDYKNVTHKLDGFVELIR